FAAEKYLQRQCSIHLDKDLDDIENSDLDDLATWIEKTGPLIASDSTVQDMKEDILDLRDE
ncbi:MAG: hypothetical protein SVU32_08575, partial [Candidatus Nanohaloarchaea archaeon]|nr:hypothetical protein [Candidatus Nanohaloarchaea archaeon]